MEAVDTQAVYWPLGVYAGAVIVLIAGLLLISHVLGPRHREGATGDPFESGVVSVGYGRLRYPAHFFLVAVFFVIFDLEAVFVFAWAVAARAVGWPGYLEILVFVAILAAALFYLWRVGALEWGGRRSRRRNRKPAAEQAAMKRFAKPVAE
jgi:NADH-quinone oxidoreductase subunit A